MYVICYIGGGYGAKRTTENKLAVQGMQLHIICSYLLDLYVSNPTSRYLVASQLENAGFISLINDLRRYA
jgi:hypothetical protein